MISKKTKYGLHALIYLANHYDGGSVLISDLAREERIPKKFLEAILLDLKKQGLLESKKGKGGGYSLSKHPSDIKVGQIVRILDGTLAPVACVSQTAYRKCDECRDENCCGIRIVMKEVRDAIANILDKTSLEDVIQKTESKNLAMNLNYHI
ncbi:MAG: Rrf2 family transcriptional regulator [Candidatus Omnitrophica bacterium]|nr:Rrf2 family transcriptional regulator [Candidatus Omnitrophota bacterium]